MTEAMKKFKPPFHSTASFVEDKDFKVICDSMGIEEDNDETLVAALIAEALNFYYAKKGEKE